MFCANEGSLQLKDGTRAVKFGSSLYFNQVALNCGLFDL